MTVISSFLFGIVFLGSAGYFGLGIYRTWGVIAQGKGFEDHRFDQLPQRIWRTIIDSTFQPKMFRDFVPAFIHALIFWGFILVSIGTLETVVSGFYSKFNFSWILGDGFFYGSFLRSQDLANAWVGFAILYAIVRRITKASKRISSLGAESQKDAYYVLTWIFALVFTASLSLGARAYAGMLPEAPLGLSRLITSVSTLGLISSEGAWHSFDQVIWWAHVGVFCSFLVYLPTSKHQHFIWAVPNLFFRTSRARGRLRPMDLEDETAESFGVAKPTELSWKQLLDGFTCVECGRCQEVCPAYQTGKPLDPRKIAHDLKYSLLDDVKAQNDKEHTAQPLTDGFVKADEYWSCTTCGACMEACPLGIEHIPAIVDMRRYKTLTEGEFPSELNQTFKNLETNFTPWSGVSHATRADWSKDQNVTTFAENSDVEYCFWVGCAGSFDERYQKVSKSIVKILQAANISFSILGTEEKCNGDTARRLGNEYLAQMSIQENIQTMQKYKIKKIVTGCPHCFNTIRNEYPDFGFEAEVIHHSELIEDLLKHGKIKAKDVPADQSSITYHDSCYLGRHNEVYEEPRETLKALGAELKEMEKNKKDGMCCGAGGGRMWMEETIGDRVNEVRAEQAIDTGASTVAVACPFCMTMMQDGVKAKGQAEGVTVKDVSEIVAENLI